MSEYIIDKYVSEKNLSDNDKNIITRIVNHTNNKVAEMNKTEILDCLCSLNSPSYNTLYKYVYVMRNYVDFLQKGGEKNAWNDITKDDINNCLSVANPRMVLTRESILQITYEMRQPSDRFCILAAYEGFTIPEMLKLRKADFNFEEGTILHPISYRWFDHSAELMQFAEKALTCYDFDADYRVYQFYDIEEGIPSVIKSRKPNRAVSRETLTVRLFQSLSRVKGAQGLSAKAIHTISFCMALENNKAGLPVEDFISTSNREYLLLLDRYGKTKIRTNQIKEQYRMYLGGNAK